MTTRTVVEPSYETHCDRCGITRTGYDPLWSQVTLNRGGLPGIPRDLCNDCTGLLIFPA